MTPKCGCRLIYAAFRQNLKLYMAGLGAFVASWISVHLGLSFLPFYQPEEYGHLDPRHIVVALAVLIGALIGIVGYESIIPRLKVTNATAYPFYTFLAAGGVAASAPLGAPHILFVVAYYYAYVSFDKIALDPSNHGAVIAPNERREIQEWLTTNKVRCLAYFALFIFVCIYDFYLHARAAGETAGTFLSVKWGLDSLVTWVQHAHTHAHPWDRDVYNIVSGAVVFEVATGSVAFLSSEQHWFKENLNVTC